MKMCDRCSVPGCCLTYRGKACEKARDEYCPDVQLNNAEYITGMSMEQLAVDLIPIFEFLCEDGVPSPEYMRSWLRQPYDAEWLLED